MSHTSQIMGLWCRAAVRPPLDRWSRRAPWEGGNVIVTGPGSGTVKPDEKQIVFTIWVEYR
jgi:hypothetical protein